MELTEACFARKALYRSNTIKQNKKNNNLDPVPKIQKLRRKKKHKNKQEKKH